MTRKFNFITIEIKFLINFFLKNISNSFKKDNSKFYLVTQKALLAAIILINLSYLVFLFRNSSISKIFNLPELYASGALKYHFVILQAALFFAFIYCLRNLLNIFENKNEGKIENFKKLLEIDNRPSAKH